MKQLDSKMCWQLVMVMALTASNQGTARVKANLLPVPAFIIFGDSTVDVGNNNELLTLVKSDFAPYGSNFPGGPTGRFCDGDLTIDYCYIAAEVLGLPYPLPYLSAAAGGSAILKGINFASSASGWYNRTAVHFNVKYLATQFDWYSAYRQKLQNLVGVEQTQTILSKAFYIISTGANDYVNNYYENLELQKEYNLATYQPFILGWARHYVQVAQLPLTSYPQFLVSDCFWCVHILPIMPWNATHK